MAIYLTMAVIGKLEKGKNLEKTLEDMKIGEIGYITPWSLAFDEEKVPYLNINSLYKEEPGGTAKLAIKKIGSQRKDYEIDISKVNDYEWGLSSDPFGGVMGVQFSEIVQLDYKKEEKDIPSHDFQNWKPVGVNPSEYPATHKLREWLNVAVTNEHYALANRLIDKINNEGNTEKLDLESYVSSASDN